MSNAISAHPRFYGKAKEVAESILRAFQEPERLPAALAPIFIHRRDNAPCRAWSWANQLIVALHGYTDARGYRQWLAVGRQVGKGQRAFFILSPIRQTIPTEDEEDERIAVVGFKATPVFGASQTDGPPLPKDWAYEHWLASLPLHEVPARWGLRVAGCDGHSAGPLGSYGRNAITLRVKNLSTWCHELVHAADDRNGTLTELGQHWPAEVVAELGGAVLLSILGRDADADLGGCWQYISAYAERAGIPPITACQRVLKRTCDAVSLILDAADELRAAHVATERRTFVANTEHH